MLLPDGNLGIDQSVSDEDTLYAFYDLQWLPISFDIAFFLMSAEISRSNQGLRHIMLVFVPAQNTIRPDLPPDDATWNLASLVAWRFHHICLPLIPMFPTIAGFIFARSRAEGFSRWATAKHQFPDRRDPANLPYTPLKEFHHPAFVQMAQNPSKYRHPRALPEAIAMVTQQLAPQLGSRRLIVITLRHTRFSPNRNSNLDAWMKFAESLDPNLYLPIFVPDTETVLTADFGVWKENCFVDAAFDLQLRMALYESAWLNLFVSSGPFALATLNGRCRTLGFKLVTAGASEATAENLDAFGFPKGKNPLYATPFQRWVWQDDDYPVIMREFEDMVQLIEASERAMHDKISAG